MILRLGLGLFQLTFYLHDLVCVLDHLVLGFIPEGMCPGLDQVQDLVPNINFHLPLWSKKKVGRATGGSGCLRSQREEPSSKTNCAEQRQLAQRQERVPRAAGHQSSHRSDLPGCLCLLRVTIFNPEKK